MNDLDELAAEMRFVDLSAKVRRSHRKAMRRRVSGAASLVLAAIVGATVAWQLWTPEPEVPTGTLDGTVVTAREKDDRIAIHVGDQQRMRLDSQARDLTLSPDGERLAWRQSDSYYVATLDDGDPREIVTAGDSCVRPVWAPDGEPLVLTGHPEGGIAWYDIETEEQRARIDTTLERGSGMCETFPVTEEEGGYRLYYGTGRSFEMRYLSADDRFHNSGIIAQLPDNWDALTGMSPGGEAACLSRDGGKRCDTLIDTETPSVLREIDADEAWFLPDGELLTRHGKALEHRDATGTPHGEPAPIPGGGVVLGFLPE